MHIPVLKSEALSVLDPKVGETIFEGTGGEGGLSVLVAEKIGKSGTLVITDLDERNLETIKSKLGSVSDQVVTVKANFRDIKNVLSNLKIDSVSGILLDLGLSSPQIEDSGRGFTFMKDEPLLMTYDSNPEEGALTAEYVLNHWKEENLSEIFAGFGGEKKAKQIAKKISEYRRKNTISSTSQLVEIVSEVYGGRKGRIHPATRVFQALRIAVNDEIGALRQVLTDGWDVLGSGGRFLVITFHDLEDREVKKFFQLKKQAHEGELIAKKPIVPTRIEIRQNPRSRSAKLRAIRKI